MLIILLSQVFVVVVTVSAYFLDFESAYSEKKHIENGIGRNDTS